MSLGKFLLAQRRAAYRKNKRNIQKLLDINPSSLFLDLGCDDGVWTMKLADKIGSKNVYGIEIIEKRAESARQRGVIVKKSDLNGKLPYKDEMFDIVHANQVIEHLNNTDLFVSEIYRVLKPGGYAIISTENLSSWHNIGALILGFMPFSLVNISAKTAALGNPLAPHNNESFWESDSWQHQRVFTIKGLTHLFSLHGFDVDSVLGAGYYPFGNIFDSIDRKHSAFITLKIRK